jgi:hypothetical protein
MMIGDFLMTLQILKRKRFVTRYTKSVLQMPSQPQWQYKRDSCIQESLQSRNRLKGGDDDKPDEAYANVTAATDRLSRAQRFGDRQKY